MLNLPPILSAKLFHKVSKILNMIVYTFTKRIPKTIYLIAIIAALFSSFSGAAQDGEKLFKANCASCHKVDKKLVGPALQGIRDRWEDEANLIAWIKNSQDYLKNNPNDKYAADLYEQYNKSIMPAQALSDEEVVAVLDYIDAWQTAQPAAAPGAATATTDAPAAPAEDYTFYWLLAFALVFLIVIRVLIDVRKSVRSVMVELKGEAPAPEDSMGMFEQLTYWFKQNKKFTAFATIIILVGLAFQGWDALLSIGVYQGYEPEQPIKFSHKIHAGENGIACVYCHHSAEKSKHSGIPSVNICMNCHAGISEGKRYGTEEIAKIYDAAGWNPETSSYDKPQKPIKWIRIHNLPDFAYFNHSQHVVVGGVECQTCHGPVEEMDVLYQYSDLTMGWCINCHRETNVQMKDNGYYDQLHNDLKEIYKEEGIENFKVEHIGGLECAKCHY